MRSDGLHQRIQAAKNLKTQTAADNKSYPSQKKEIGSLDDDEKKIEKKTGRLQKENLLRVDLRGFSNESVEWVLRFIYGAKK